MDKGFTKQWPWIWGTGNPKYSFTSISSLFLATKISGIERSCLALFTKYPDPGRWKGQFLRRLTALLWALWPPPDRLRILLWSGWGRASTQNFFSRITTSRRQQGMHFKGLSCKVASFLSPQQRQEGGAEAPALPPFLAQTQHSSVTRKASLPWIDAAKTDVEGKRRVLLRIRYKYIGIYLYRDLIVQSCMPYGHSMWSECGPPAPTRSWP